MRNGLEVRVDNCKHQRVKENNTDYYYNHNITLTILIEEGLGETYIK